MASVAVAVLALAKVGAGDRAELLRLVVVDSFPSLSAAAPNEG